MSASKQNPNKSLSSAAAAAALRARPQTPTNVAELQTKRTLRRSASISSSGSAPAGPGGITRRTSQLERRASNGSMTERTFRTPSPHRSAPAQHARDEPPVPRIPEPHKKSASSGAVAVGMQTFRTASQRKGSDLPSWYTQPHGDTSNVRTSDALFTKSRTPKIETKNSMPPRSDSRSSSRNYSYPSTFRPQSPPASPSSTHVQPASNPLVKTPASPPRSSKASIASSTGGRSAEAQMVYDPNSRRMVPVPVEEIEYQIRDAAEKQPKKKSTGVQRSGSHLAKGTVARARGTFIEDRGKERNDAGANERTVGAAPIKEQRRSAPEPLTNDIERRERLSENRDATRSLEPELSRLKSPPPQPQPKYSPPERTGSPQPDRSTDELYVEPEESEDEEVAPARTALSEKVLSALDSVPTRQKVFEQPRTFPTIPTPIPEEGDSLPERQPRDTHIAEAEQAKPDSRRESAVFENKPVLATSKAGSNMSRSNSNSPVRQARFANSPPASLAVRHNPLPRSASPIKPALKHTGSTREVSPSDASSDVATNRDASPNVRGEAPVQRKKSVRVSFDDQNTKVVGESAQSEDVESPTEESPQPAKRPWYSNIGRSKRREITLEDDEVMKPRPALPSFGSVREKKTPRQPEEERPLVRPYEPAKTPSVPSSPAIQPSISSLSVDINESQSLSLGQSSDQAIGTVLSQDQASRNPANISRFREPLPPVVTSAEGLEYTSDTSLDTDQDNPDDSVIGSDTEANPSTRSIQDTQLEARGNSQNGKASVEDKVLVNPEEATEAPPLTSEIPEISIIQPSPMASQGFSQATGKVESGRGQYFDVPGGFPIDTESEGSHPAKRTVETKTEGPSQSTGTIFEPTAEIQPSQTESLPQTTLLTAPQPPVDAESEESDRSSIYSDAYEDLSDIEEPGFQSLDAVVDTPVTNATTKLGDRPTTVQGTEAGVDDVPATTRPVTAGSSQPPPGVDDWEQAKHFWRSLTTEKRQQLEREASEDAGADGDREEVALPIRRNSSRKKLAGPKQPEAVSKPQAVAVAKPKQKPAKQADADRTYMIQPGSKPNHASANSTAAPRMRNSLREQEPTRSTQPQASTQMRKSMRSGTGQKSAGRADGRAVITKKEKPMSLPSNTTSLSAAGAGSALSNQNKSPSQPPLQPALKPALQRRGSDASDSSFKRSRPTTSGGLSFKKTMRQPEASGGSSRFSLRSLSPGGSVRRNSVMSTGSAPPVSTMRRTLRSGSESSQEGRNSTHFSSFGRSGRQSLSKKGKKPTRFEDDSDDEEIGDRRFRSRFDDSSDEDVAPTPLQGGVLAKGTLRGSASAPTGFKRSPTVPEAVEESPELPDSDDDLPAHLQTQQRNAAARAALGRSNSESLGTATLTRSRSGHGGFDATVSTATVSPKRGSIMSILRRNKKVDQGSKIQRSGLTESAARRDTKLERNADQLKDIRPVSPKLQKRNGSLKRGESWPLPEDAQQPGTAANVPIKNGSVTGSMVDQRPSLAGRRSTSLGISGLQGDDELSSYNVIVASDSHKKKKKFGALRRMLHLDS
ncbi:hypothetical protein SLS62_001381 [Diatrype stigma]|uniref:Uncharacterized protein n=1 Tax=Diatrype stigma TaxID=117547 RepID=A0AAN9YWL7_9PEZI